jgi:soluble lytic murein transglycosylase-like protein
MLKLTANSASLVLASLSFLAVPANAQITSSTATDGRKLFINAEPPVQVKLNAFKRTNIFLPRETPFAGRSHPAVTMDRDGVEKLVREAADRHRVDPALIRAVIQTESNWNPIALSNKGAGGLMQLIPTTAHRFGVNDVFNPQQNIDGGVHYLKTLLERYGPGSVQCRRRSGRPRSWHSCVPRNAQLCPESAERVLPSQFGPSF